MVLNNSIPNSLISTKVLLDAYTNLRDQLNGKCHKNVCPHYDIRYFLELIPSHNKNRIKYYYLTRSFGSDFWNYRIHRQEIFCIFCQQSQYTDFCPCKNDLDEEDIFLRLDEIIDQLEEKIKKEFSS